MTIPLRGTTQSPLLRHFSVSLRNNSQPSNEVLLREYLFITPIVTEILPPETKKKTSRFSSEGL